MRLAGKHGIRLLWLPRQYPKLNPVDHLWRSLKNTLPANRQFASADELAAYAEKWVRALTPTQTLRKAGPALAQMLAQASMQNTRDLYSWSLSNLGFLVSHQGNLANNKCNILPRVIITTYA